MTPTAMTSIPPSELSETGIPQDGEADQPTREGGTTAHVASQDFLTGREMTLQLLTAQDQDAPEEDFRIMVVDDLGEVPEEVFGREPTLQTMPASPPGLTDREMILQSLSEDPPTGTTLTGREQTLQTAVAGNPDTDPSQRNTPTTPTLDSTPAIKGDKPKTATEFRATTGGTSAGFDDSWHLQGRKGPHTGQTWGDFELGGILGEGGMGAVYRAKQISLKRRVAIKVLPPNLAADSRLLQLFQLEATTSSKLTSPHIVQVYFIGEHEDNHYYAMEYVDGTDLYDLINKRKDAQSPLTPDEAATLILQAAKGLAEAARHGVVHRDIKPPNMMMTRDGLLKIADFGIVKVMGEHNLTMTIQAVGTPAYCSPEQGRGDATIDCRSDLYSLGVVFYELACGRKPFEATTPNALIYKHCYDEPDLPRKLNPAISDEYQAVILRSLAKKPENRYQTADEMVRDLEAIRTGSMVKSAIANYKRGTGAAEAKREQLNWIQRNLVKLSVAAVVAVGVVGTGGYILLKKQHESANAIAKAEAQHKLDEANARAEKQNQEAQRQIDIQRATIELRPWLSQVLDATATVPEETEGRLVAFAKTVGEQDADAKRWKAKLVQVRSLQKGLAILDGGSISAAQRNQARKDLVIYQEKVSTTDAAGIRWEAALVKLDTEENTLRSRLAELDHAQTLTEPAVEGLKPSLTRLTELVSTEDRQLKVWTATVVQFDQRIADLRKKFKPLEEEKRITEARHGEYTAFLNQLKSLVAAGDQDLQRWSDQLAKSVGRVQELRRKLADFTKLGRPSVLEQNAIKADLAELILFVGAEDADVVQSQAKIKAANEAIAGYRTRLGKLDQITEGDALHRKAIPANKTELDQLTGLALPGDDDVIRWTSLLARFTSLLDGWDKDLQRLDLANREEIALAQGEALAATLDKALAKGVVDEAKAGVYRQRLADEKRRVERLRSSLATLDMAAPLGPQVRKDLARFAIDVGQGDADVARWLAKQRRIDALIEKLKPLDEPQRIPDQVQGLFDALVKEVGAQDADVVRWQDKATRVAVARKALTILDRVEPIPASAEAELSELSRLVGNGDEQCQMWKKKFDEVSQLKAVLRPLPVTVVQSPAQNARTKQAFRRAISLVSAGDPELRAWAPRQQELDGPQKPTWASDYGRDEHGLYADLPLGQERLRFRFVPTGRFVIGSPPNEQGRDFDEIQVPMVISQAFWMLEHEITQDTWVGVLQAGNPSLFVAKGAGQHPVERVNWDEIQTFLTALNRQASGLDADLPSEAQWEYAARSGSEGPFPKERPEATVDQMSWASVNAGGKTHEVKLRFPNCLGLYDLLGNVAEWCRDSYAPYPTTETADHVGKGSQLRVARGGSWGDGPDRVRVANRIAVRPEMRSSYLGFRIIAPVRWTTTPTGAAVLADAGERVEKIAFGLIGAIVNPEIRLPQKKVEVEPAPDPVLEPPVPLDSSRPAQPIPRP